MSANGFPGRRRALLLLWTVLLVPLGFAGDRVVVVHPDTKVKDLSFSRLKEVFKAETLHWDRKTRVTLVLPKSKSEAYEFLLERVYKMKERDLARHWIQLVYRGRIPERPRQFPSTKVMLRVVARTKGAVAIIDRNELPEDHGLKILTVDGKRPGDPGYPLAAKKPKDSSSGESLQATSIPASQPLRRDDETEERLSALEEQLSDLQLDFLIGEEGHDLTTSPRLKLQGFGHVQFTADSVDSTSTGIDSRAALGGLDFLVTSRLSENTSLLTETVFEPKPEGDYVLDVERVIIKYDVSDSLNIQAGRFHTTIGRWNELYHHGEYLQTSAGRPAVLDFEDENGLIPVHLVGLVVKGAHRTEGLIFDYALEAGNGRGPTPDPPQVIVDANDSKAVNVALSVRPRSAPELRVGGSYYVDRIPSNTDPASGAPLHGTIDETIASAFVEYERDGWRGLAEYFRIEHDGAADTASNGWFVELSRVLGDWTPYVRLDGVAVDDQDRFFFNADDRRTAAAGTRYELADWTALRLQYEHTEIDLAGGGSDREDRLLLQVVFAF